MALLVPCPRRFAVGVAAGVSGVVLGVGAHRLLLRAGLAAPLPEPKSDPPPRAELLTILALAGAWHGAGYALVRPLLPRRPELAGTSPGARRSKEA